MGDGVLDKAFTHGEFGYGDFHQIKACHLIDNAQFAGCRPITGIEFFVTGAVEVNAFSQCFKNGKEVDLMICTGKAVGFEAAIRLIIWSIFYQCYQVSF